MNFDEFKLRVTNYKTTVMMNYNVQSAQHYIYWIYTLIYSITYTKKNHL